MVLMASAAAAVATAASSSALAAPTLTLTPCTGLPDQRCGRITVPLDYSQPTGLTLSLPVRVLPASGPRAGVLVSLGGGPGQAMLDPAGITNSSMHELAPRFDIVTLDQRGTGEGALSCGFGNPSDLGTDGVVEGPPRAAAACAAALGDGRRFYTSRDSARDLDMIRQALGAPALHVYGVSYGTVVASTYGRMFPATTASLALDSVVPPGGVPVVSPDTYAAARRALGEVCRAGACRGVTRNLAADVARLDRQMARRPIPAVQVNAKGVASRTTVGGARGRAMLFGTLIAGDMSDAMRAIYPVAVAQALRGDATLLRRLAGPDDEGDSGNPALWMSTVCAESPFPWGPNSDVATRVDLLNRQVAAMPRSTFAPFAVPTGTALDTSVCIGWPGAPTSTIPGEPLPAVPTLILNGSADIRTPLEAARAMAAQSPQAQLVVVRRSGHSVLRLDRPCVMARVRAFYAGRSAAGSCAVDGPPPARSVSVPPTTVAQVMPAKGMPARPGRILSVMQGALSDVRDWQTAAHETPRGQVLVGPWGGTARITSGPKGARIVFTNYRWLRGAPMSGTVAVTPDGRTPSRISVSGAAGRGRVVIGDRVTVITGGVAYPGPSRR